MTHQERLLRLRLPLLLPTEIARCCSDLPELEPHQYGFRAGYLGSAFNLGSIFAGFFWGRLADAIGRRPVFLMCVGGLAVLLFAFAFAPTFWSAVVIRGLAGTFMGIPPVVRTYLADITDETNMATGFSLIGVVRGCVLVVGPALGGFLVNPAEKFGGPFDNFLFRAYPFCLPILVGCFGLCCAFVGVYLYLPETLEPPPPPLRVWLAGLCGRKSDACQYTQLEKEEEGEEDSPLLATDDDAPPPSPPPPPKSGCLSRLGCGLLKQRKVFLVILTSTLITTVSMGSQEVFALWVLVDWPKGGFRYDSTDIALISSICGAMMPPVQLVLFPPFERPSPLLSVRSLAFCCV